MTENNINKIKIILIDNNGNTITSTIDYKGYVDGKNIHGFNLIEDVIKVMIKDYEETKQKTFSAAQKPAPENIEA